MYSLACFSISDMTECASELRKLGAGASSAQEVAQRIASYLYRQLGNDQTGRQDCALVRCFFTRAYRELDSQSQDCARQVLGRAPDSSDMKCLTLLGTAGERPEWNERDRSRRYRSIPLAGKQFVSQFPMFSQLLQQLGVELKSKTQPDSDLLVDWTEQTLNVFHVTEAKGSTFVPAQEEFVIPFGIESVLGFGGVLPSKELFTVILFSKQKISRETAELFKPLALSVKLALLPFDGSGSQRSTVQVESQPGQWQARAEALEQLLVAHERIVTHHAPQRKQAPEEVRNREEQFRQVFEEAPVGMIILGEQRHFIRVNRAFCNLVGYNEAELIGRGYELCTHPDDFQANVALTNEFYEGKRTGYRLEKRYIRKDGQVIWVAVNATAYRIPAQQPKVVLAVIEDITERKQAEEALRLAKFSMDRAADAVYWIDAQAKVLDVNEAASLMLGYSKEELCAMTVHDLSPDFQADIWPGFWAETQRRGTMVVETAHRAKNGRLIPVEVSVNYLSYEGKEYHCAFVRDITERKRAEEALRESEERFKAVVTNSPALVFLKDTEGRYLQVNRRFEDSFHVANRDLVGKTDQDIFPPEQAAAFRANDRKVLEAGRPMEFEEVVLHDDGPHTSIVVKFPLLNAQGECYALCGIVTDITERKRAGEELRRSEAFITSVVENLPNMIFVKDAKDLKFVRFNKAGEDLLGQSREVLIGKSDYDLFPKEEADFFTENDRQVLASGCLLDIPEEPIETKHQGLRILHTKKIPICDDTGEPQYLLGISEDITDWKRAEMAQKESEERYRRIFENAAEGIFQTTLDGKYVAVNPALARTYGYDSPDDMIAGITNIASQLYVDPGRRDEFIRLIQAQGEVTGFEALVYRKDGSFIWIAENVRALRDPAGVLVGYEGMVENITERKLAERRLLDTLDQVRTLSGRLTTVQEEERTRIARELHDELGVRLTCLKIDLSRLHTMMSEGAGAGARKKAGNKIRSMVEQIDTTIASVQRLVTELRPAVLDDLGLVAAIEWQCQDFQKRTGIPCTCVTSADDIAMEPERATALFRICQEALTNTARHAQATAVTIKLESRSDFLQLVVADNGVGIPDTKVSNRRSLGLLGMKERVALFGGEITIQSNPGKGTTITACLPR